MVMTTINGVPQIVLLHSNGATNVAPADGKLLWEHAWPGEPIVQPAVTESGDVLMSVSESSGIAQGSSGWTVQERWTSEELNPWFNDFVVHNGHVYGGRWAWTQSVQGAVAT